VARELESGGATTILDYLGENVSSEAQADAATAAYRESLVRLSSEGVDCHISIKLTQLGLDLSFESSLDRMKRICSRASEAGTVVAIDMESHEYTDRTIDTYRRLRADHDNVVLCLQAYLRRTPNDVESLLPLDPKIRLCKGAYDEPTEIALGRRQTRAAFRRILQTLLDNCSYTAIATHDEVLVREAIRRSRRRSVPKSRFEFQMLFGVRRDLQKQLVSDGFGVRIYVPFGNEWYPYLMRRIAERPANLRFFLEALARG
jgi:proline dehydrogenase